MNKLPQEIRLGIFGGKLEVDPGHHTGVRPRSDREFVGTLTIDKDGELVDQHTAIVQAMLGLSWAAGRQLGLWSQGAEGTKDFSSWLLEALVLSCLYRSRDLRWHLQAGCRPRSDIYGVPSTLTLPDESAVSVESEDHEGIAFKHSECSAVLFAPPSIQQRHLVLLMLLVHLGAHQFAMQLPNRQIVESGRALLHGLVLSKLYSLNARLLRALREEVERDQAQSPTLVSRALLKISGAESEKNLQGLTSRTAISPQS